MGRRPLHDIPSLRNSNSNRSSRPDLSAMGFWWNIMTCIYDKRRRCTWSPPRERPFARERGCFVLLPVKNTGKRTVWYLSWTLTEIFCCCWSVPRGWCEKHLQVWWERGLFMSIMRFSKIARWPGGHTILMASNIGIGCETGVQAEMAVVLRTGEG